MRWIAAGLVEQRHRLSTVRVMGAEGVLSTGWNPVDAEPSILLSTLPPFWLQAAAVWAGILLALLLVGLGACGLAWLLGVDGG